MSRLPLSTRIALFTLLLFSCLPTSAIAQSYENITISVPAGTYYQPATHEYCVPSRWYDIVAFFLANYVTHAATVKSLPGQPMIPSLFAMFSALLFPGSGAVRAVHAIYQRTVLCSDPLVAAARAGALCMVVRTKEWAPQDGETTSRLTVEITSKASSSKVTPQAFNVGGNELEPSTRQIRQEDEQIYELTSRIETGEVSDALPPGDCSEPNAHRSSIRFEPDVKMGKVTDIELEGFIFHPSISVLSISGRKVFGTCCLPKGYGLRIVPANSQIVGLNGERSEADWRASHSNMSYNKLSPTHSMAKPLFALLQLLFASFTLYRARGDQINRYGLAAFGLTVAPYLVMSILNFTGSMLTADYASVFLVESSIMKEAAKREGSKFEGVVGKIDIPERHRLAHKPKASSHITPEGHEAIRRIQDKTDASEAYALTDSLTSSTRDKEKQSLTPSDDTQHIPSEPPWLKTRRLTSKNLLMAVVLIMGGSSLGIIGGLSHFRVVRTAAPQAALIVVWLVWGFFFAPRVQSFLLYRFLSDFEVTASSTWFPLVVYLVCCAPAVGVFVVVAQMLKSYGTCYPTY